MKGIPIFQMNHEIYKTANLVDWFVQGLLLCSGYGLYSNLSSLYALGFSFWKMGYASLWTLTIYGQLNYLFYSYMRQVFLVSQIELLPTLEHVKITTVLSDRTAPLGFRRKEGPIVAHIRSIRYSEKDRPDSSQLRIIVKDKKYFCHKNMSLVQDFELLKAVLTPDVHKIEVFK